jgi:hypothetical protein
MRFGKFKNNLKHSLKNSYLYSYSILLQLNLKFFLKRDFFQSTRRQGSLQGTGVLKI